MMMKRKGASLIGLAVICLILLAAGGVAMGAEKVYHWKWYTPYNLTLSPSMDQLPKMIEQRTNGRVQVRLYVGGEHPFQGPDLPRAIKTGACQMADVLPGHMVGIDPRLGAIDLPFFANSAEEEDALNASVLKNVMDKVNSDYGMTPIATYPFPGQAIVGKVLLENMDSLKGKKIRVFNKVTSDMIATLGGSPVTLPFAEVYQALERGVVDGALGSMYGHLSSKMFEVAKNATRTDAYAQGSSWTVVVSKAAFEELPKDLQGKVLDAAKEYQEVARKIQYSLTEKAMKEAVEKYGVKVITLDSSLRQEIRKKMKEGVWEKWAKGFPGGIELLSEMERFHDEWVKTHK
jgi:TRAP-type transport system periplasmic protein